MGTKYILKIVPIKFAEGLTVGMGWCVHEGDGGTKFAVKDNGFFT